MSSPRPELTGPTLPRSSIPDLQVLVEKVEAGATTPVSIDLLRALRRMQQAQNLAQAAIADYVKYRDRETFRQMSDMVEDHLATIRHFIVVCRHEFNLTTSPAAMHGSGNGPDLCGRWIGGRR